MTDDTALRFPELLRKHESQLLVDWIASMGGVARRAERHLETELRDQCGDFLRLLAIAARADGQNIDGSAWSDVRSMLTELSRSRARQGFTSSDTASFIFSLKQPLFSLFRVELANDLDSLFREIWAATMLLDRLGLFTVETYQKAREEVIARQQQEMLELSTPVVKLWEGILALPVIGTLDSARTQVMMEVLLQSIVDTGSQIAIIDITGVPTVDTLVAQHLMKTVAAARLMGADCIISGIRPQIAQTIVHLGVDLSAVTTKARLSEAFALALRKTGATIEGLPTRTTGSREA